MGSTRLLSIHLLRDAAVRTNGILESGRTVDAHAINVHGQKIGTLYIGEPSPREPNWRSLFDQAIPGKLNGLVNSTTSAVFVIPAGKRTFALTFGYGRFLLAPGSTENGFGLRVTLNSVDPNAIRSIDKTSFDSLVSHTRTQGSLAGTPMQLGIDAERDLMRAVTGSPIDGSLGMRLAGMDALSASVKVGLTDLPALLERYLRKSEETGYRKDFPWVDQVREIRDDGQIGSLDATLSDRIRKGDLARIWLAVPELVEWAEIEGFTYRPSASRMVFGDLDLNDFLDESTSAGIDADFLRHARVHQIDSVSGNAVKKWPVYRCVCAEMTKDDKEFVLSGGRWYEVDSDYVARVDTIIDTIPEFGNALPDYNDVNERAYNTRLAAGNRGAWFLMDFDLVRYGGARSSFEFCDVITADRQLIHVKNYGGSAVLSHLFAQGLNSAKLFLDSRDFREKLQGKLPASVLAQFPLTRPDPTQYEIVYAVVSDSDSAIKTALPFFSRMNLKAAATQLWSYGFRVSIAKIRDRTVAVKKAA
jgi:uncharacterized protein (TIGR04141 family)